MKTVLPALLMAAASLAALNSCKPDASENSTETVTTTTTTTTYEGAGQGSGGDGAMDGGSTSGNAAYTGAGEAGSNERTVYVNENRRSGEPRKKKTVVRKAYTPGNFPESSERLLTERDMEHLSAWGRKLMKNEIYARHGMTFTEPALKEHFAKQSWYDGKHRNVDGRLTAIERQNLQMLNSQ